MQVNSTTKTMMMMALTILMNLQQQSPIPTKRRSTSLTILVILTSLRLSMKKLLSSVLNQTQILLFLTLVSLTRLNLNHDYRNSCQSYSSLMKDPPLHAQHRHLLLNHQLIPLLINPLNHYSMIDRELYTSKSQRCRIYIHQIGYDWI